MFYFAQKLVMMIEDGLFFFFLGVICNLYAFLHVTSHLFEFSYTQKYQYFHGQSNLPFFYFPGLFVSDCTTNLIRCMSSYLQHLKIFFEYVQNILLNYFIILSSTKFRLNCFRVKAFLIIFPNS